MVAAGTTSGKQKLQCSRFITESTVSDHDQWVAVSTDEEELLSASSMKL